ARERREGWKRERGKEMSEGEKKGGKGRERGRGERKRNERGRVMELEMERREAERERAREGGIQKSLWHICEDVWLHTVFSRVALILDLAVLHLQRVGQRLVARGAVPLHLAQ